MIEKKKIQGVFQMCRDQKSFGLFEPNYFQPGRMIAVFPVLQDPCRSYPVPWRMNIVAHWVLDAWTRANEIQDRCGPDDRILCAGIGYAGSQAQACARELRRMGHNATSMAFGPAPWSLFPRVEDGLTVIVDQEIRVVQHGLWASGCQTSVLDIELDGRSDFVPCARPRIVVPVLDRDIEVYDRALKLYRKWEDNE